MTWTGLGMVVWGGVTVVVAGLILWVVWRGSPNYVARVKDCSTALGAIVAASTLAWSYFYQAYDAPDSKIPASTINLEVPQIDQRLKEIEDRLSKIEAAVIKKE